MLLQKHVDQGRARLTHAPVDEHGARAAHFLQAVAVPHDGATFRPSSAFAISAIFCSTLMQFMFGSWTPETAASRVSSRPV